MIPEFQTCRGSSWIEPRHSQAFPVVGYGKSVCLSEILLLNKLLRGGAESGLENVFGKVGHKDYFFAGSVIRTSFAYEAANGLELP